MVRQRGALVRSKRKRSKLSTDERMEETMKREVHDMRGYDPDGPDDDRESAKRRLGIVKAKDRSRRRRAVHDMREYVREEPQRRR